MSSRVGDFPLKPGLTMRLPVLFALFLIVGLAACTRPGDPVAGDAILSDWTAALSSGEASTIQSYIDRHGLNASVEDMLAWHDETAGVDVLKVTERRAGRIEAILQTRLSDQLERVAFDFDDSQPTQITRFTYLLAERTPDTAIARLDEAAALGAVQAHGDRLAAVDQFSGALLIARNGEVLLERYWGHADREAGTPVNADTRFRHGSLDKLFTGIATLRLVERGALGLASTVGQVLPDYPQRDLHPASVRDLLAHRAGAGDIFGPEFDAHRTQLRSTADYLRIFGERDPDFDPGSEFRYSNYGYLLLAAMLEKTAGVDYYSLIRREVFEPAGMTHSGAEPESTAVEGRASGYRREARAWVNNANMLPWRGMAAGGGYSTARDLWALGEALRNGRLLQPATLTQATAASTPEGWYGLGMMLTLGAGPSGYGHDGGAPGMSAYLRVFPGSGYVVVALSNLDPPRANWLADTFVNRMPSGN